MLSWQLTDRNQRTLAWLQNRRLGHVTVVRCGGRFANVTLSLDDPAVPSIRELQSYLKVKFNGTPLFIGRVTTPRFEDQAGAGDGGASARIEALDPWNHLQRNFFHRYTDEDLVDVEQGLILKSIVAESDQYNGNDVGTGISDGVVIDSGIIRTRKYYSGKQIAEAITQLCNVIDGPEFELQPFDATDGRIVKLNVFPPNGQGAVRPAKFQYGTGLHNVSGFAFSPSGEAVVNRYVSVGEIINGWANYYVAEVPGSIAFYGGAFEYIESAGDISGLDTLEEHARGAVATSAYAINDFSFTLPPQQANGSVDGEDFTGESYGDPPICGPEDDFWIGDIISIRVRRNIDVLLTGRIDQLDFDEDDQGAVTVGVICSPVAVATTDVTGFGGSGQFASETEL